MTLPILKNPPLTSIPLTNRLIVLLLALFVTLAFHNCLQNDFIGDDKAIFTGNQFYKDLNDWPKIFSRDLVMDPAKMDASKKAESFSGCISYRPVPAATFFIDYALWKENPLGHHFSNILLHFLATVLVFYFILRLSGNPLIAFWTASFFAVHPLQSEVVNASGYRSDILMTIFYLAALLGYIRYSVQKSPAWIIVTAGAYVLALFSKETALTFPVVVFLFDHFFLTTQNRRMILHEKKGLYLILAGLSIFYLYVYFILVPNTFYLQAAPLALTGIAQMVLMLKIFLQYFTVLLFPWKISILPPLYAPPIFPLHFWEMIVPLFAVLFFALLGMYFYRRNKIVTFGFLWFFINYFPTSGFFPLLNPLAFRFLYLPSIGFFLAVAVFFNIFTQKLRNKNFALNIVFLFQSVVIGLLIALTVANNAFFRNNFVACQEMIRRYPQSSRPYWILGLNYYLAGQPSEAVKYLRQHLEVPLNNPFISSDKEKFMTYHLLGKASADPDVAIGYLKKADALFPGFAGLYLDLSKNYIAKKDYRAALAYAKAAAQRDPFLVSAYVYIVHINIEEGHLSTARAVLDDARKKFDGDKNLKAVEKYLQQSEQKERAHDRTKKNNP